MSLQFYVSSTHLTLTFNQTNGNWRCVSLSVSLSLSLSLSLSPSLPLLARLLLFTKKNKATISVSIKLKLCICRLSLMKELKRIFRRSSFMLKTVLTSLLWIFFNQLSCSRCLPKIPVLIVKHKKWLDCFRWQGRYARDERKRAERFVMSYQSTFTHT